MNICGIKYWQLKDDSSEDRRTNFTAVKDIAFEMFSNATKKNKIPKEDLRWLLGIKVLEVFHRYFNILLQTESDLTGTLMGVPFSLDTENAYTIELYAEVKFDAFEMFREECFKNDCKKCMHIDKW